MSLPLADLRVLDLTIARAGPTAVRQLADWGADVVRIERPPTPGKDIGISRRLGHDYQNLHRNKRCLTLDLKQAEGREVLVRLARDADVLVENYRAGVKHRLGFDYETVRAVNPRIVYASVSGFGQTGPYRERGGVDQIAQGLGGLMSVTGLPGQGPVRVGTAISDLAAGLYLAFGIMAALRERERSGEGQWVTTSLLEAMIGMLDFQAARYLVEGEVPGQQGNHHPTIAPMGTFPAADGWVNIAATSDRHFHGLCQALGGEELLERPEYGDSAGRVANRARLEEEVAELTRRFEVEEVVERLNAAGLPCGPVYDLGQTFADPQVEHSGIAVPLEHPDLGRCGLWASRSASADALQATAPGARVGEHTDEILAEAGLTRRTSTTFGPASRSVMGTRRRFGVGDSPMSGEARENTSSEPGTIDLPTTKIVARIENGVGWLTYNNPERRNALSFEMQVAQAEVLRRFQEDPAVRVVVLRGAGDRAFVSGADISEFEKLRTTAEARERYDRAGRESGRAFAALEKPLIAMIRGYCLGGGLATALNADLRIASEDSTFGIPAGRLGVGYGFAGIKVLVDLVGPSRTSEILLTARRFRAAEALHMGLVDRVTAVDDLEGTVRELAGSMTANAPLTLRAAKFAIRQATKGPGTPRPGPREGDGRGLFPLPRTTSRVGRRSSRSGCRDFGAGRLAAGTDPAIPAGAGLARGR